MSRRSFALGALAGSSTGGGHYYGGVTMCDPKDDSFYCKLHRLTNEIHMILFIIMLIAVPIYFLYKNKDKLKKIKK